MIVLCRFHAPAHVIDSILAKGYQRVTWGDVVNAMHYPHYTESFSPKWDPDGIVVKECYSRQVKISNGKFDTLYVTLDRSSGIVYAVAQSNP